MEPEPIDSIVDTPSQTQSWSSIVSQTITTETHHTEVVPDIVTFTPDVQEPILKEESISIPVKDKPKKQKSKKERKLPQVEPHTEPVVEETIVVEETKEAIEPKPSKNLEETQSSTQSWSSIVSQTIDVTPVIVETATERIEVLPDQIPSSHDIQDFIQKEQNFSTVVNDKPKKEKIKKEKKLAQPEPDTESIVVETTVVKELKKEPESFEIVVDTPSQTQSWSSIVSQTTTTSSQRTEIIPETVSSVVHEIIPKEKIALIPDNEKPKKQKSKKDKKILHDEHQAEPIVEKAIVVDEPKSAESIEDSGTCPQSWSTTVSQTSEVSPEIEEIVQTEIITEPVPANAIQSFIQQEQNFSTASNDKPRKQKQKKEKKSPREEPESKPVVVEPTFVKEPEAIDKTLDTPSPKQSWSSIVSQTITTETHHTEIVPDVVTSSPEVEEPIHKEENISIPVNEKAKKKKPKKEKLVSQVDHVSDIIDRTETHKIERKSEPIVVLDEAPKTQSWSSIVSQTIEVPSVSSQEFIIQEQQKSVDVPEIPEKTAKPRKEKKSPKTETISKPISDTVVVSTEYEKAEPTVLIDEMPSHTSDWSEMVSEVIDAVCDDIVPDFIHHEQKFTTTVDDNTKKQRSRKERKSVKVEPAPKQPIEDSFVIHEEKHKMEPEPVEHGNTSEIVRSDFNIQLPKPIPSVWSHSETYAEVVRKSGFADNTNIRYKDTESAPQSIEYIENDRQDTPNLVVERPQSSSTVFVEEFPDPILPSSVHRIDNEPVEPNEKLSSLSWKEIMDEEVDTDIPSWSSVTQASNSQPMDTTESIVERQSRTISRPLIQVTEVTKSEEQPNPQEEHGFLEIISKKRNRSRSRSQQSQNSNVTEKPQKKRSKKPKENNQMKPIKTFDEPSFPIEPAKIDNTPAKIDNTPAKIDNTPSSPVEKDNSQTISAPIPSTSGMSWAAIAAHNVPEPAQQIRPLQIETKEITLEKVRKPTIDNKVIIPITLDTEPKTKKSKQKSKKKPASSDLLDFINAEKESSQKPTQLEQKHEQIHISEPTPESISDKPVPLVEHIVSPTPKETVLSVEQTPLAPFGNTVQPKAKTHIEKAIQIVSEIVESVESSETPNKSEAIPIVSIKTDEPHIEQTPLAPFKTIEEYKAKPLIEKTSETVSEVVESIEPTKTPKTESISVVSTETVEPYIEQTPLAPFKTTEEPETELTIESVSKIVESVEPAETPKTKSITFVSTEIVESNIEQTPSAPFKTAEEPKTKALIEETIKTVSKIVERTETPQTETISIVSTETLKPNVEQTPLAPFKTTEEPETELTIESVSKIVESVEPAETPKTESITFVSTEIVESNIEQTPLEPFKTAEEPTTKPLIEETIKTVSKIVERTETPQTETISIVSTERVEPNIEPTPLAPFKITEEPNISATDSQTTSDADPFICETSYWSATLKPNVKMTAEEIEEPIQIVTKRDIPITVDIPTDNILPEVAVQSPTDQPTTWSAIVQTETKVFPSPDSKEEEPTSPAWSTVVVSKTTDFQDPKQQTDLENQETTTTTTTYVTTTVTTHKDVNTTEDIIEEQPASFVSTVVTTHSNEMAITPELKETTIKPREPAATSSLEILMKNLHLDSNQLHPTYEKMEAQYQLLKSEPSAEIEQPIMAADIPESAKNEILIDDYVIIEPEALPELNSEILAYNLYLDKDSLLRPVPNNSISQLHLLKTEKSLEPEVETDIIVEKVITVDKPQTTVKEIVSDNKLIEPTVEIVEDVIIEKIIPVEKVSEPIASPEISAIEPISLPVLLAPEASKPSNLLWHLSEDNFKKLIIHHGQTAADPYGLFITTTTDSTNTDTEKTQETQDDKHKTDIITETVVKTTTITESSKLITDHVVDKTETETSSNESIPTVEVTATAPISTLDQLRLNLYSDHWPKPSTDADLFEHTVDTLKRDDVASADTKLDKDKKPDDVITKPDKKDDDDTDDDDDDDDDDDGDKLTVPDNRKPHDDDDKSNDRDPGSGSSGNATPTPENDSSQYEQNRSCSSEYMSTDLPGGVGHWRDQSTYLALEAEPQVKVELAPTVESKDVLTETKTIELAPSVPVELNNTTPTPETSPLPTATTSANVANALIQLASATTHNLSAAANAAASAALTTKLAATSAILPVAAAVINKFTATTTTPTTPPVEIAAQPEQQPQPQALTAAAVETPTTVAEEIIDSTKTTTTSSSVSDEQQLPVRAAPEIENTNIVKRTVVTTTTVTTTTTSETADAATPSGSTTTTTTTTTSNDLQLQLQQQRQKVNITLSLRLFIILIFAAFLCGFGICSWLLYGKCSSCCCCGAATTSCTLLPPATETHPGNGLQ
ncbi:GH10366 [Drosophila grimshawi]|uniref:GH10366 n=1 Tax=Drosophila grimshawi TaxID=7222 RepID=B4JEG9_DROGR|nr:GH10366 [Drosophila grimshawi]